ncbi:MAG: flagellar motor switch protein FliN [Pseudomonadota bacterium]
MSEETPANEQAEAEVDDWAAAMAEQAASVPDEAEASTAADLKPTAEESDTALGAQTASATVFEEFSKDGVLSNTRNDIDMILDIPVQLTVELGRTKIAIKNLLQLAQGSVVELDGMAGEPMDVLVNGCLIAQGEVVVVNDKFGIRLTDIITPSERIRKLNR